VRLGRLAERYLPEDPNTCLLKLRQLAELLAQLTATRVGVYASTEEKQSELLQRLERQGILSRKVAQLFFEVRKAGNDANHALQGDHRTALASLKSTQQLGLSSRFYVDWSCSDGCKCVISSLSRMGRAESKGRSGQTRNST
jgi:type I restriction enzyme, R subunit